MVKKKNVGNKYLNIFFFSKKENVIDDLSRRFVRTTIQRDPIRAQLCHDAFATLMVIR